MKLFPYHKMRLILFAQLLWLGTILLLGIWWARFLTKQANHIAELEHRLGVASHEITDQLNRTQRMLTWESASFFILIAASAGFLSWLYWRDSKRTKSLGAFFASVTHELKTPLTSIRLQAESIAETSSQSPTPSSQQALLDRLLEDTYRLEAQVERTLELARLEGGGSLYVQPLGLKPTIERTLDYWLEFYDKRLKINLSLDSSVIQGDSNALQLIIKNLVENSIKHAKKDSIEIQLQSELKSNWVVLHYKDDGQGFKGDRKKLGTLFFKGAQSQGTGIGLYLVSHLMEKMGGKAEFTSTNGFQIALWFPSGEAHV